MMAILICGFQLVKKIIPHCIRLVGLTIFLFGIFVSTVSTSWASNNDTCRRHLKFRHPFAKEIEDTYDYLSAKDKLVLHSLITKHLGHRSFEDFKRRGFLAFQFYSMPNYFRYGAENDLHYKLMMHFREYSDTIIYNSVRETIVEAHSASGY